MAHKVITGCWFSLKYFPFKNAVNRFTYSSLSNGKDYFYFCSDEPSLVDDITKNFKIFPSFVSENEEGELMIDVEPKLKRQRYQFDHWDDAIHGFKETETVNWNEHNALTLQRLCDLAFAGAEKLPHTHILDLAEDGHIKPHVDSVRYCGDTIAGISLLSDSIMRLIHTQKANHQVDILLPRRSLYIMTNSARYEYTHEILHNSASYFNGNKIHKFRRVSVICRSSPMKSESVPFST